MHPRPSDPGRRDALHRDRDDNSRRDVENRADHAEPGESGQPAVGHPQPGLRIHRAASQSHAPGSLASATLCVAGLAGIPGLTRAASANPRVAGSGGSPPLPPWTAPSGRSRRAGPHRSPSGLHPRAPPKGRGANPGRHRRRASPPRARTPGATAGARSRRPPSGSRPNAGLGRPRTRGHPATPRSPLARRVDATRR